MLSKNKVVELGNKSGFELARMCSAEKFTAYEETVKHRIKAGLYPQDLVNYEDILKNVDVYADPSKSLSNAKTIISLAFSYYTDKSLDLTKKGDPHGIIAKAYQKDVYGEKYRRRQKFAELLRKKGIKVAEKSFVPHKMAAIRSGVGWQGKNSLIQTEKFGSWITLDSLIVDAEFEPDEASARNCGSCRACQHACPTSAIESPGVININKCIDYLTMKTGVISLELRTKMENKLMSCDRCQEVCPNNQHVKPIEKGIPENSLECGHNPALLPLLIISEKEFEKYAEYWEFINPKLEYLQRNVIIALGNLQDAVAVPALKKLLHKGSPLLKEHTEWAIDMINSTKEA